MAISMTTNLWNIVSFIIVAIATKTTSGFVVPKSVSNTVWSSQKHTTTTVGGVFVVPNNKERMALFATEENKEEEAEAEEAEAEEAEAAVEEEEEEVKEDPEVTALKDEIAKLESTLKYKKNQVMETKDLAERYTKGGYARKVAEMENMRRARSMVQSTDKTYASAQVLQEFLPVYDQLTLLKEKYAEDAFGKSYVALSENFLATYTNLGVTEYTTSIGEPIDTARMIVVDSVHDEATSKNTVLKPLTMGMELKGNIIRMAECIESLGPKQEEAPADDQEEASTTTEQGEEQQQPPTPPTEE